MSADYMVIASIWRCGDPGCNCTKPEIVVEFGDDSHPDKPGILTRVELWGAGCENDVVMAEYDQQKQELAEACKRFGIPMLCDSYGQRPATKAEIERARKR